MSDKSQPAVIQVPGVDFAAIARQVVAHKLTEALSVDAAKSLIDAVILDALNRKVNDKGHVDQYHHHNTLTMVEWLARDTVSKLVREVFQEEFTRQRPKIEAQIRRELGKQSKGIAAKLVGVLAAATQSDYRFTIQVGVEHRA